MDKLNVCIPYVLFNFQGSDLKTKLDELGAAMEGHKNSFEYVQDYIGINGVKMWQVFEKLCYL